jgi:hypothetical protein
MASAGPPSWSALSRPETAPQLPYINSPYADKPVEPSHFSPKNIEQFAAGQTDNYVKGIRWSSWGQSEAIGIGLVALRPKEFQDEDEGSAAVSVILGGLQQCAGVSIYTSYHLEVAPGQPQPEGWPAEQSGTFPCLVGGDGYARQSGRRGGCFLGFMHRPLPDPNHLDERYPGWSPKPPGKGSTAFCDLRWTQWGGVVAIGDGLRENLTIEHQLERNWPVKLELLHPVWCPRAARASPFNGGGEDAQHSFPALAYSVLKLTEYGKPRKPSPRTLSSYGHRGLKGRVYWQRLGSLSPSACAL